MTVRRKNRMFTRIHVPIRLQSALGCKEIIRSLKTASAVEAKFIDEDIQRELPYVWQEVNIAVRDDKHSQEEFVMLAKGMIDTIVYHYTEPFTKARLRQYGESPLQAGLMSQTTALTAQVASMSNGTPIAKAIPLWSIVAEEWLAEKTLSLKAASIKDYKGYLPVMLAALGKDKPVADISRAEFTEAIKRLGNMQSNHNRPFSQRSIEKYANGLSMVCNYAVKAGYIDSNICPAISKKSKKDGSQAWKPFTDEELTNLFKLKAMNNAKKPHLRAVTLIGLLSGLRLNEIVQLEVSDLKEVDGVRVFDVNDDGEKELKSSASRRVVPVHPRLCSTLDEFVASAASQGSTRLFPALKSADVSKQINRIIRTVSDGAVMHSTRKRFAKALTENGVDKAMTAALLGHRDELGVTTIYTGDYPPRTLKQAVESIEYTFI